MGNIIRYLIAVALVFSLGCGKKEDEGLSVKRKPKAEQSAAQKAGTPVEQKPTPQAKPAQAKTQASVSTPPLELAQTKEATGMQPTGAPPAPGKPTPEVPFTPSPVKANTNVVIVFDASGSMSGPIESDTKMSYVKSTIKDLLVQPPPTGMQRTLGLRVFGSQYPVTDQQCEDTLELSPLGPIEAANVGPAIDGIEPKGTSPLAYALQQAAATLPPSGPETDNMIILIADGSDTCQADPCLAAKQIHDGPSKAMVHVIGFDLDKTAEQQLRCIADNSDGRFFLARNVAELRSASDQALNANLPYNLRVKVFAGATPLPTQMTVYKSGTRNIVEETQASGIKFFQLQPGTYDILITYAASVQDPKPSKLLKGVEVQQTARAEQVINFDLGVVEVSGIDPEGDAVALNYALSEIGDEKSPVLIKGKPEAMRLALTPGQYTLTATGPTINNIPMTATLEKLNVKAGESITHTFRFEAGTYFLRGQTSLQQFIPITYRLHRQGDVSFMGALTEGEIPPNGKAIELPVGMYTLEAQPQSALLNSGIPVVVEDVEIEAREQSQQLVTIPVGQFMLIGKEGEAETPTKTEFEIRRSGSDDVLHREVSKTEPVTFALAPGLYQVTAIRRSGKITPPPTVVWEDLEAVEDQTVAKETFFKIGDLQLQAQGGEGQPMAAEFSIYRPGVNAPIATQRTSGDPITFKLTPGNYDVKAQDVSTASEIQPIVWTSQVPIAANEKTERKVIFTSGRVRLTCRGTNEKPIHCKFRIFTYGQDAPLYAGETTEHWQEFEMDPGYYYLEVAFFDKKTDQILKKWLNISVAENATVEKVVRF